MAIALVVVCLISVTFVPSRSNADTSACVNEDPCTCKFEDGNVLSLRSLAKSDSTAAFRLLNVFGFYDFYFNPCLAFTEGSCGGGDVAVCQHVRSQGGLGNYTCGVQSSARFVYREFNTSDLYLRFDNGDDDRKSYIKLVCGNGTESSLKFLSELPMKVYNLELTSPCACPGVDENCKQKLRCIKEDDCSCRMSDGSGTINLRALSSPQSPIEFSTHGRRQFLYNPCQGFRIHNKNASVNQCHDVSLCGRENVGQSTERNLDLGKPSNVQFDFSSHDQSVSLAYRGAAGRSSTVKLVCDRRARERPVFEFVKSSGKHFTFLLRSVCACPGGCVAPARFCQKVDSCTCKYDDGSGTISLHYLDNPYSPLQTAVQQFPSVFYNFFYNPCSGLKLGGSCSHVSACQKINDTVGGIYLSYRLGALEPTKFIQNNDGAVILQYSGGDQHKTFQVTLVCDHKAVVPVFGNASGYATNNYSFTLRSRCACPNACLEK